MKKKRKLRISILAMIMCITVAFTAGYAYGFSGKSPFKSTGAYGTVHNDKFKNYAIMNGLDISEFQTPSKIDFSKLKKNGVDFVIIRAQYCGLGTGKTKEDACFYQHYTAAKKAGLLVGVYSFSQSLSKAEAKKEAAGIISILKKHNISPSDLALPVYMDYETNSYGRFYKNSQAKTAYVTAFCETVKAAGYEPGVYANLNLSTNGIDGKALAKKYDYWIAQYNSECQFTGNYTKWQYYSEAKATGYSGNLDVNYWYLNKNRSSKNTNDVTNLNIAFQKGSSEFIYSGKNVCPKITVTQNQEVVSSSEVSEPSNDENTIDDSVQVNDINSEIGSENVDTDTDTDTSSLQDTADSNSSVESVKTLKKGVDYSVFYLDNIKKGTGYVFVKGIGEYSGYKIIPFTIKDVEDSESFELKTTSEAASAGYSVGKKNISGVIKGTNAGALKKALSIDGSHTIEVISESEQKLADSAIVDSGDAVAVYNANNKLVGVRVLEVDGEVIYSTKITNYIYNGKIKKPAVTAKFGNNTVLDGVTEGNTYAGLTYTESTLPGTYYVTITGKGIYAGIKLKANYKIMVKTTSLTKLTNNKTAFTAYWEMRDSKYITGYQIQYSRYADMTLDLKKKITSYNTTKDKIKVNYPKNTYYVRIRTYKTINDKNYYSAWSKTLSVNVK